MAMKNVCVVVGAGPGMGRAAAVSFSIAQHSCRFAKEGFMVALMARSHDSVKVAEQSISSIGGKCSYIPCDVSKTDSIKNAFEEVREKFGHPNVLIYNPSGGGYRSGGVLEVEPSQVEECWRVNCLGCLVSIQQVLPEMLKQKRGTILCTSATAAFRGSKHGPAFPIAKFGLRALTQSVAKEYSSQGIHCVHIRLDCVLDTPKAKSFMGDNYDSEQCADVDAIADTYWHLHTQNKRAWTNEIDIRPYTEDWTF